MAIRFKCITCGKELKTAPEHAGKRVKCPGCGNLVTVPEEILDAEAVPEPAPVEAVETGYRVAESESPRPQREDDRVPCSACGELIKATAVKCRYCGEIFDETLRRAEKKRPSKYDEDMTGGDWALAILCSGIGCILGIVWVIQGKPKGWKMLGVSLLVQAVFGVIRVMIEAGANAPGR